MPTQYTAGAVVNASDCEAHPAPSAYDEYDPEKDERPVRMVLAINIVEADKACQRSSFLGLFDQNNRARDDGYVWQLHAMGTWARRV